MPKQNAMIAVGSIFLVAAIVAGGVALTHHLKHLHDSPRQNQAGLTMLVGSVVPVCETMDHIKTLSQENVTMWWRDLIQSQIKVAIDELSSVMKNTMAYEKLAKDPRRDRALRVCNHVLDFAIGNLRRSVDNLGALEFSKINQHTNDLRSWLRSSYSYAETCIDALNSNDMKGSKLEMENALIASAKEPVRNALVMADRFASTLKPVCTRTIKSRRLLAASASLALPLSQTR